MHNISAPLMPVETRRILVTKAEREARVLRHGQITPEHFLLAILHESRNVAKEILRRLGVNITLLLGEVQRTIKGCTLNYHGRMSYEDSAIRIIRSLTEQAIKLRDNEISTAHILLSLLQESQPAMILAGFGVTPEVVQARMEELRKRISSVKPNRVFLKTLQGYKIDRVIACHLISRDVALRLHAVPLKLKGDILHVATSNLSADQSAIEEKIRVETAPNGFHGLVIKNVVVPDPELKRTMDELFAPSPILRNMNLEDVRRGLLASGRITAEQGKEDVIREVCRQFGVSVLRIEENTIHIYEKLDSYSKQELEVVTGMSIITES